jgi:SagB-type dehydrogenase family enzyme
MTRLRQDLDHLTSVGLLVAAVLTGVTGIVADLWDLNDFWYHTLAGYVMGAFAIAHVWLNWRSLVGYARFRLSQRRKPVAEASHSAGVGRRPASTPPELSLRSVGALALSRRGLLGLGAGAVGGWALGRGLRPPPQIPLGSDVGVIYHQWSKPGVIDVLGSVANWGQQPPLYKEYPGRPLLPLPTPALGGGIATEQAIVRRRSVRDYSGAGLSRAELSRLLHLSSGISTDHWDSAHRTAPSSGALYPIEIYPVVHNVEGLVRGVYHYDFREHGLRLLREADLREQVVAQGLMQEYLGQCDVVLFLTNIMQRMRFRYQDRSYRYALLEAGHIGQNLYLAATSMGLGACSIGAFMDDPINAMLGVDGVEEAAIYMLAVGRARVAV